MERLAKVFGSPARLKMLRLVIFNKDSAFTFPEIERRTKLSKETVRREVADLLAAGLLRKRNKRHLVRYQTNPAFEHLSAVEAFINATTSMRSAKILRLLKRAGTPRLVALSGHFTSIVEPQVDLLVVGDSLNERALSHAVHALEAEYGREIRYASFTTADFRYRMGVYDRLLRDVFDYPHRLVLDKIGI